MPPEPVSSAEFERWMKHLDSRFDKVEEAQAAHEARTQSHETEIAVLKAAQSKSTGKYGAISAAVAGVVGGLISYLNSGAK